MLEIAPILAFMIVMVGASLIYAFHREKKLRQEWVKMGRRYDLEVETSTLFSSSMNISGQFRGRQIKITRLVEGHGKSRREFTVYEVPLGGSWPWEFQIRSREFSDRVAAKFRGLKGYRVGEEDFDKAFLINRVESEDIRRALGQREVQEGLIRLLDIGFRISIGGGMLRIREQRTTTRAIEMKMILDRMCDAAELLHEAVFEPAALEATRQEDELFASVPSEPSGVAW
jgi:hypothetical protein